MSKISYLYVVAAIKEYRKNNNITNRDVSEKLSLTSAGQENYKKFEKENVKEIVSGGKDVSYSELREALAEEILGDRNKFSYLVLPNSEAVSYFLARFTSISINQIIKEVDFSKITSKNIFIIAPSSSKDFSRKIFYLSCMHFAVHINKKIKDLSKDDAERMTKYICELLGFKNDEIVNNLEVENSETLEKLRSSFPKEGSAYKNFIINFQKIIINKLLGVDEYWNDY